jgi:hypothetical protein
LIDGVDDFPDAERIKNICENRITSFDNVFDFISQYLDETERMNPFLVEVVKSLINIKSNRFEHYMDNATLFQYLSFLSDENMQNIIMTNLSEIKFPIILFTSKDIHISNDNIRIIKIDQDDHLLMLTQPHLLAEYI